MFRIRFDMNQAKKTIDSKRRSVGNMSSSMKEVGQFLEEQIDQSFTSQRDPYGKAWVPLKDSTLELRARRGNHSSAILEDSGAMRASLTFSSNTKSIQMQMQDPSEVHQMGYRGNRMFGGPSAPIPMRKIFPIVNGEVKLPNSWMKRIIQIFTKMVERT